MLKKYNSINPQSTIQVFAKVERDSGMILHTPDNCVKKSIPEDDCMA